MELFYKIRIDGFSSSSENSANWEEGLNVNWNYEKIYEIFVPFTQKSAGQQSSGESDWFGTSTKFETKSNIFDLKSDVLGDRIQIFKFTETKIKTGKLGNFGTVYDSKGLKGYEVSLAGFTSGVDFRNPGISVSQTIGFYKLGIGISVEGISIKNSITNGNISVGYGMTFTPGYGTGAALLILATRGAAAPYVLPPIIRAIK